MFGQLGVRGELRPRRGSWFPPGGLHRPRDSQRVRHPENTTASLLLTTEGSSVLGWQGSGNSPQQKAFKRCSAPATSPACQESAGRTLLIEDHPAHRLATALGPLGQLLRISLVSPLPGAPGSTRGPNSSPDPVPPLPEPGKEPEEGAPGCAPRPATWAQAVPPVP